MSWPDAFSPRNKYGETEADVNWRIANFGDIDPKTGSHMGRDPGESQWGQYGRVLNYRNASLAGGGRVGGGSSMRPSLSALKGYGRYSPDDDPNMRVIPQTAEQERQGRVIAGADARTQAGLEGERRKNDAMFDLGSGRFAAGEQILGDIRRDQGRQDARSSAETYFDPAVRRRREDEMYQRMEELRRRYTDPAIAKAQADLEEARIRGTYGVDRERVRGQYGLNERALQNEGQANVAGVRGNAQIGAAVAATGGDPTPYRPPAGPSAKTMSMQELQEFATENQMPVEDARAVVESFGYRIQ